MASNYVTINIKLNMYNKYSFTVTVLKRFMMIGFSISFLLSIFIIARCFYNAYKRPNENFPPGPPSLPLYGSYWIVLMKKINDISGSLKLLAEEYNTKILGLYLGAYPTVVIDDPDLIKECLNREEFNGRNDVIINRSRSFWKRLGIFFTDGYFWHIQRRFTLRSMRDYGFGRREESLETCIASDIREMIDMAKYGPKYPAEEILVKDDLIYLQHYFAAPFINEMLLIFARNPLPRPQYQELWEIARNTLRFQRSTNELGGALSLTPWLKDVMPKFSGYRDLISGNQYLLDLFHKLITEAMSTYDKSYIRHFLDAYICKMKEETQISSRTTFSVEQLQLTCMDYMFPAATGLAAVITFLVERMLYQPEIQDKIHEEIDRVVGRDRLPTLDDRQHMPYTEACIREMLRYETLLPLGVLHRATQAANVDGYDIPENTVVVFNYKSLHLNKKLWGDPENFRPERFIEDGKLKLSNDKSLPFGAGQRLCPGETFARQSIFQVFSAFMQAFHVSTVDGKPLKKLAPRIYGIITNIKEFWVRATPRT